MYARITHYQFDPAKIETVEARMGSLKEKIQTVQGLKICTSQWREDGNGVTVAVYEDQAACEAATETVMAIWAEFSDALTAVPSTEVYDTVEDLLS